MDLRNRRPVLRNDMGAAIDVLQLALVQESHVRPNNFRLLLVADTQ
jgi:hypothetical protein